MHDTNSAMPDRLAPFLKLAHAVENDTGTPRRYHNLPAISRLILRLAAKVDAELMPVDPQVGTHVLVVLLVALSPVQVLPDVRYTVHLPDGPSCADYVATIKVLVEQYEMHGEQRLAVSVVRTAVDSVGRLLDGTYRGGPDESR